MSGFNSPWRFAFLSSFIVAKAAIYLLPFAIAYVATPELYAGIETALAGGLLVAAIFAGAPMLGINQAVLIKKQTELTAHRWFIGAGTTCFVCAVFLIVSSFTDNSLLLLIIAVTGGSVLQNVLSGAFRMQDKRISTSWADGYAVLSISISLAISIALLSNGDIRNVAWVQMLVVAATGIALALQYWRSGQPVTLASIRYVSRLGLPMMVLGVCAIWIGTGGRIQIGAISLSSLAIYALAFRVAGIAHGIRQFAATAFFVQIYRAERNLADRWNAYFLGAVVLLLVLLCIVAPAGLSFVDFAAVSGVDMKVFAYVLTATSVHTLFWIGYAMLQTRINRYEIASRLILPTMAVSIAGVAAFGIIAILATTDLIILSWTITAHAAAYFALNALALVRIGEPHPNVVMTCLIGSVVLILSLPVSLFALEIHSR